MASQDDDFRRRLLSTFGVEAREHIRAISSGLIALENTAAAGQQPEIVEAIFREAHSLKGAARTVNLTEIEAICQALESVFAALKRQEIMPASALFDALHRATDMLSALLVAGETGPPAAERAQIMTLVHHLEGIPKGSGGRGQGAEIRDQASPRDHAPQSLPPHPISPASGLVETVRISTTKLDSLLLQAEELLAVKLTLSQRAVELREINAISSVWHKERAKIHPLVSAMQRSFEKVGQRNGQGRLSDRQEKATAQMRHILEFLEWNDAHIKALHSQLATLATAAERDHRALGSMVDDLLQEMKRASMLPFSSALEILPKLVRDLARDRGKEVEVVMQGGEIEIDRRVLEEMKDPLIHIVRNCIDHGIEAPQERAGKNKPPRGAVTVVVAPKDGSHVELLVADDGEGVDVARVKSAVCKLGLVTQEEADALSAQEVLSLIFQSGVSTSPLITNISGRGLGLAIVREKVEKLGGVVSLETSADVGTTFRVVLPLTLATLRGVLVQVAERLFVIPTTHVERVLRVNTADIKTVENRETLLLNGQVVSLVRLEEVLELWRESATGASVDRVPVVVVAAAAQRIALLVDAVLNEQDILVKGLGPQLRRVRNIAGATVLGTGQVVAVLNVPDVLKSAVRASAAAVKRAATTIEPPAALGKTVLVVEDSITARMLLKNLLEAAGYRVVTAVDGIDGLRQLRSGAVDIVITDVDMPRMDGFALTAKIRSDKAFADLPVVLVTALASREDRERGIEVGANAYLVKSSFEQSNLLEVIQRLV
jgi:two-component system chemotaxis sensor kinase CheA